MSRPDVSTKPTREKLLGSCPDSPGEDFLERLEKYKYMPLSLLLLEQQRLFTGRPKVTYTAGEINAYLG